MAVTMAVLTNYKYTVIVHLHQEALEAAVLQRLAPVAPG